MGWHRQTSRTEQNGSSPKPSVIAGSRFGAVLLISTAAISFGAAVLGQQHLRQRHQPLTPKTSSAHLWQTYRWAVDPAQRREAALLMVATLDNDASRRQRLLASQGWGTSPLAAVALGLAAQAADDRQDHQQAQRLWRQLLRRFPEEPSSAWARNRLADQRPELLIELLEKQPGHPAALAAAEAMAPNPNHGHEGALHLARWGVRWPGTSQRLSTACNDTTQSQPTADQRQRLARGLAQLGKADAAQSCLNDASAEPATALAIARARLHGTPESTRQGKRMLLQLAQQHPKAAESREAARLLSEPLRPDPSVLDALPEPLASGSASVAAARVRLADGNNAVEVIQRWPEDPDVWQLQWDLARDALLTGDWPSAIEVLERLPSGTLPGPLEARRLFWLGFSLEQNGQDDAAETTWRQLVDAHPVGYYPWRARVRLNAPIQTLALDLGPASNRMPEPMAWRPLTSQDAFVDTLWRLGLNNEAWEHWRLANAAVQPLPYPEQLVEGRLRLAIGDVWTGLDRLWRLSLRWRAMTCEQRQELQRSQSPVLFASDFRAGAATHGVRPELLLAITKQESRFSPGVRSIAGAIGLMQLMPATAAEMAGRPLEDIELEEPAINIDLGAAYLRTLLRIWDGNPFLTIASYNAGPGAVNTWRNAELSTAPELWVERIPYPETRYYVKKVLDNFQLYNRSTQSECTPSDAGIRKDMPEANP